MDVQAARVKYVEFSCATPSDLKIPLTFAQALRDTSDASGDAIDTNDGTYRQASQCVCRFLDSLPGTAPSSRQERHQ